MKLTGYQKNRIESQCQPLIEKLKFLTTTLDILASAGGSGWGIYCISPTSTSPLMFTEW